jgi:hypothetical protein
MWRLLFDETTVKKIWQLVHALDLLQTEYKGYRNQTASTCSGSTTEYKGLRHG